MLRTRTFTTRRSLRASSLGTRLTAEQSHADPVDTKGPEDEPLEGDDETEDDTEVD